MRGKQKVQMAEIVHIAFGSDWADAVAGEPYLVSGRGMTVADEGFVHCSLPHQVAGVLARHFAGVDTDLLTLVVLDTDLIEADGIEVKYEDTHGTGENYPHVYGQLQPAWAIRTEPVAT